jgi:leader peptidase (prepilin peptidase)/N-methyltransferase
MPWLFPSFAFGLGAIIGSFLNVVIHRYPRRESIVFPASRCPHCRTVIKPYDNVPILAWLWLRGRCRTCKEPIDARYPLVELANALFYLALYLRTGPTPGFVLLAALVSMTITLIYIDLDIQILPDVIDKPGIVLGLVGGVLGLGALYPDLLLARTWQESAIGAVAGAAIIWAIAESYRLVRKIEGMGRGDIKMMAMIGAILGWEPLFAVLLTASMSGALIGVIVASRDERGMKVPLPFGVFLGFALLALLFFGNDLFDAWLHLLPEAE